MVELPELPPNRVRARPRASDIIIPMKNQYFLILVLLAPAAAQSPLPGTQPLTTPMPDRTTIEFFDGPHTIHGEEPSHS